LNHPPDIFQGYGEIVLSNILPLQTGKGLNSSLDLIIWDNLVIGEYSTVAFEVHVLNSLNSIIPLKITICWYDPPSIMGSSSNLLLNGLFMSLKIAFCKFSILDLDLLVESPNGDIFVGNIGKSDRSNIKTDDSNPNEQVYIEYPACASDEKGILDCIYKVFIQSYSLTKKQAQKFAVVFTTNGKIH
jgi:hypothetical protein